MIIKNDDRVVMMHPKDGAHFAVNNLLSELATDAEKRLARRNLGIEDEDPVTWGKILGNIVSQKDLLVLIDLVLRKFEGQVESKIQKVQEGLVNRIKDLENTLNNMENELNTERLNQVKAEILEALATQKEDFMTELSDIKADLNQLSEILTSIEENHGLKLDNIQEALNLQAADIKDIKENLASIIFVPAEEPVTPPVTLVTP